MARVSILRCDFAVAMEEEGASFGISGVFRAHFGLRGWPTLGFLISDIDSTLWSCKFLFCSACTYWGNVDNASPLS